MADSLRRRMQRQVRFEAMYAAHAGAVRAFAYRRAPADAADDVVSDVFVAAWRRLENAPEDELAWLLGIARGVLANRRRGEARRRRLQDRLARTAIVDPETGSEGLSSPSGLLRALASLSERDREVLLLIAWDGLDRERAARVIGVSPRLFSLRLHRARRRLQRVLAEQGDEERFDDPSSVEVM